MDDAERLMFLGWSKMPQFKRKVEQSKTVIREALAIAPAYVACSWGKDSLVLAHLAWTVDRSITLFHHGSADRDKQDNYNEVETDFLRRFPLPYMRIDGDGFESPDQYEGFPDEPMALIGLRSEENRDRKLALTRYGLIYQYCTSSPMHLKGSWRCCPLGWWGWKDVWAYIIANNLTYLSAYDHWTMSRERGRTSVIQGKKIDPNHSGLGVGASESLKIRNPEFWGTLK